MSTSQEIKTSKPSRSSSQNLVIGNTSGVLLGLLITNHVVEDFSSISSTLFNILLALFIMTSIAFFVMIVLKERIFKWTFKVDITDSRIRSAIQEFGTKFFEGFLKKNPEDLDSDDQNFWLKKPLDFVKNMLWTSSKNWFNSAMTTILIAIARFLHRILHYNQNQLLDNQYNLLDTPNKRIGFRMY